MKMSEMSYNASNNSSAVNQSAILNGLIGNFSSRFSDQDSFEDLYEWYDMALPAPFTSLYISWLCVAGVLFFPGILGNGMIIFALFKIDKLRVPTNFLIASLAIADLLMMGVMASFVLCDVFQVEIPDHLAVYLWPSFDIFIGSASILNLSAVSFDRALAVQRPLRYQENLHLPQTFRAIRCIWGYSILMFILSMLRCDIDSPVYLKAFLYSAYAFSFGIPCLVIMVSYGCILVSTIKNVKMSRSIERAMHNMPLNDDDSTKSKRKRRLRLQEIRIALNLMVILLPFVAGWGFYFGTHFYESVVNEYKKSDLYEWFLMVIPWFNSSVNPLIYILFTTSLRKGCMKLLCRERYLSQARETAATTFMSKRISTTERRTSQGSEEKSSFFDRFSRRSRASFDCDTSDKLNGNKFELQVLHKKTKELARCCVDNANEV